MSVKNKREFDLNAFLATIGQGRKIVPFEKKQTIFTQWDAADAVFYIQSGKVRLTVMSNIGKEATIGILGEKNFFGEGLPCGSVAPHGCCNGNDRLRASAH
jgi:CRP/FNR family cyclic AMP-dependent transcriptional regulator